MLHDAGDRRFLFALAVSLLLHGGLIGFTLPMAPAIAPPPPLHALLRPLAPLEEPAPALLHDTFGEDAALPELPPAPAQPETTEAALAPPKPNPPAPPPAQAAQKLAENLLYPSEAVAAGIQGEVRVRITLDAAGTVADARIARGSGHAVLDAAALRAAYALGRLPGAPAGELVLPVIFRLQ